MVLPFCDSQEVELMKGLWTDTWGPIAPRRLSSAHFELSHVSIIITDNSSLLFVLFWEHLVSQLMIDAVSGFPFLDCFNCLHKTIITTCCGRCTTTGHQQASGQWPSPSPKVKRVGGPPNDAISDHKLDRLACSLF